MTKSRDTPAGRIGKRTMYPFSKFLLRTHGFGARLIKMFSVSGYVRVVRILVKSSFPPTFRSELKLSQKRLTFLSMGGHALKSWTFSAKPSSKHPEVYWGTNNSTWTITNFKLFLTRGPAAPWRPSAPLFPGFPCGVKWNQLSEKFFRHQKKNKEEEL